VRLLPLLVAAALLASPAWAALPREDAAPAPLVTRAVVGNHEARSVVSASGLSSASCGWSLIVNALLVDEGSGDALGLVRAPPAALGRAPTAAVAHSGNSTATCESVVRNVTVRAVVPPGFAAPPPGPGGFAPGGAPAEAALGNAFLLGGAAQTSAWSACQWVVAVNVVIVLPQNAGAQPPRAASPGSPIVGSTEAPVRSACSTLVDGFLLDVRT
jgi:hypothetical protein